MLPIFYNPSLLRTLSRGVLCPVRKSASKPPQTAMLEQPVLVIGEEDVVDLIGPPDPVSNLRPIVRGCLLHETTLQQQLRKMQDDTQKWNQEFWSLHNRNFLKERQEFIESQQPDEGERKQLNAEEMSAFYKTFLDKYWRMHVDYNLEWYKKNATLLLLALAVSLERNFYKFR